MRPWLQCGIVLFLLGMRVFAAEFTADVGTPAPEIALADQFGDRHALRFPTDRPRVLVLADREGSEQLAPWIQAFHDRFGGRVDIRGVALLGGVPRWVRPAVRSLFRRRLVASVLMDWEGAAAAAYGYKPGAALIVVARPDGIVDWRATGAAAEDRLREGFRRLDALLPASADGPPLP